MMSNECDDCGREFETLSGLRLHDCSPETTPGNVGQAGTSSSSTSQGGGKSGADKRPLTELEELLSTARDGGLSALHQAIAIYESRLQSAHESSDSERYRSISRGYQEQVITVLDDATQTEGWDFLAEFLDAYHPETADEFPHVTTVLQNVTSRYLIRTRITDGVTAIPVESLEFFHSILARLDGQEYDFITEGVHPYGWGIGHPNHPVADNIYDHASTDIFVVNAMLEHAFCADQQSAMDLLERIAADDAIQQNVRHRTGHISETRLLLDAPAGAVSEFSQTIPRYWDWEEEFEYEFELDNEVEQRIRRLVAEEGIDDEMPSDWEISDLAL